MIREFCNVKMTKRASRRLVLLGIKASGNRKLSSKKFEVNLPLRLFHPSLSSNVKRYLTFHSFSVCSDFRRKRNIYARCAFFIQSIFADRNDSFE